MSSVFSFVPRMLAWLGKRGAAGFAISMFMGLSLPWLASSFRPFLPYSIFLFVTLTFARADFAGVRRVLQQPGKLAVAVAWITLCMPVLIGLALRSSAGTPSSPACCSASRSSRPRRR